MCTYCHAHNNNNKLFMAPHLTRAWSACKDIKICTRTHTHACMHARRHACMHACTHACMHTFMHACRHTHTRMHTRPHAYTCAHARTHAHSHTHTHTHTHKCNVTLPLKQLHSDFRDFDIGVCCVMDAATAKCNPHTTNILL